MIFPELQSNRLILRAIQPDDYPRVRFLFSDFDVARMTASFPHPISNEWAQEFVTRSHSNDLNRDIIWAIDNGTGFIGSIGAHQIGETAKIGYALGKYYWRRGYMTEAVRTVVDYLQSERCVEAVESCVFLENPASFRVLLKNGFTPTTMCTHACVSRGDEEIETQNFVLNLAESVQQPLYAVGGRR